MSDDNGFSNYKLLILDQLKRGDLLFEKMDTRQNKMDITLAELRTEMRIKSSLIGAVSGGIVAFILKVL